MHADRSDLGFSGCVVTCSPNAGEPRDAFRPYAEISAGTNQHFLQPPHVVDSPKRLAAGMSKSGADTPVRELLRTQIAIEGTQFMPAQIKDGVSNQLPRPVKG